MNRTYWVIMLVFGMLLGYSDHVAAQPATSTTTLWSDAFYEDGIGAGNIAIVNNSGTTEVLLFSYDYYQNGCWWRSLVYDAPTSSYSTIFTSEFLTGLPRRLVVGDVTGDAGEEVVVMLSGGQIRIYDLARKDFLAAFNTITDPQGLVLADLDGSGKKEIVLCTTANTYVYSAAGVQLWSVAAAGGYDLTIGQMDGDPAMEIAVGGGKVIDAATHLVQWNRGSDFGRHVECADIDGDSIAELIGANNILTAFDVDTTSVKWTYTMHSYNEAGSLRVENIDNDPTLEIVTGVDIFGSTYALNSVTRTKEWEIVPPIDGITEIGIGDPDGDGINEIFWGAGAGSTGRDILYVYNFISNTFEYGTTHLDGNVVGPEVGDLDGDGYDEVVVVSFEGDSGYDSGRIVVYDYLSHRLRSVSQPIARIYGTWGSSYEGVQDLRLFDVNGDGRKEIVIATDESYDGLVEIYSFDTNNTFTRIWRNATLANSYDFSSAAVGDIDNDGNLEVVAGTSSYSYVYVYDYNTSLTEWTSPALPGYGAYSKILLANIDPDAAIEIIILSEQYGIIVVDGITKATEAYISGYFTDMDVQNGVIYASTQYGYFETYAYGSPGSYPRTSQTRPFTNAIEGFTIETTSPLTVWFGNAGIMKLYSGGTLQSQSGQYGKPFGSRYRKGFTAGYAHINAFKLASPEPVLEPALTDGTTNTVSWLRDYQADEYYVEADTDPTFGSPDATSGWITGLSYEFVGLNRGLQYYFRVKARRNAPAAESLWSRRLTSFQVPVTVSLFALE